MSFAVDIGFSSIGLKFFYSDSSFLNNITPRGNRTVNGSRPCAEMSTFAFYYEAIIIIEEIFVVNNAS